MLPAPRGTFITGTEPLFTLLFPYAMTSILALQVESISKAQTLTGASSKLHGSGGFRNNSRGSAENTLGISQSTAAVGNPNGSVSNQLEQHDQPTQQRLALPPPPTQNSQNDGTGPGVRAQSKLPVYQPPSVPGMQASRQLPRELPGKNVLPPHWSEAHDEAGEVYYFNARTGVTQWHPPVFHAPPPPVPSAINDDGDATPRL